MERRKALKQTSNYLNGLVERTVWFGMVHHDLYGQPGMVTGRLFVLQRDYAVNLIIHFKDLFEKWTTL